MTPDSLPLDYLQSVRLYPICTLYFSVWSVFTVHVLSPKLDLSLLPRSPTLGYPPTPSVLPDRPGPSLHLRPGEDSLTVTGNPEDWVGDGSGSGLGSDSGTRHEESRGGRTSHTPGSVSSPVTSSRPDPLLGHSRSGSLSGSSLEPPPGVTRTGRG